MLPPGSSDSQQRGIEQNSSHGKPERRLGSVSCFGTLTTAKP